MNKTRNTKSYASSITVSTKHHHCHHDQPHHHSCALSLDPTSPKPKPNVTIQILGPSTSRHLPRHTLQNKTLEYSRYPKP